VRESDGLELGGARARAPRGRVLEEGGHAEWSREAGLGFYGQVGSGECGRPNFRSEICPRFFSKFTMNNEYKGLS